MIARTIISLPEVPPPGYARQPQITLLVFDLELGEDVPVRWRPPWWQPAWTWRCSACDDASDAADCPHKLAAAVQLAREFFGLEATVVNTPDPARGQDERKPA